MKATEFPPHPHKCWKCGDPIPGTVRSDLCDLCGQTITGCGPHVGVLTTETRGPRGSVRSSVMFQITIPAWRKPRASDTARRGNR